MYYSAVVQTLSHNVLQLIIIFHRRAAIGVFGLCLLVVVIYVSSVTKTNAAIFHREKIVTDDIDVTSNPNAEPGTATGYRILSIFGGNKNVVGSHAPENSAEMESTTLATDNVMTAPKSAATGYSFSGKVVRTFPVEQLKFTTPPPRNAPRAKQTDLTCARWGVVTTIFEPSEAVRRWLRMEGWCLVIVGDKKSPKVYDTRWTPGEGNDAVVYLSPEDQKALDNEFVNALPWNNFGRKNVGFLYAIMHGATVIWDFDDDNMLKFWIPSAAPEGAPSLSTAIPSSQGVETIQVLEPYNHSFPTYNPYPALGAPTLPSWPRGLPLSHIKLTECHDSQIKTRDINHQSIAVLQSLAEHQPDVDAIYRITMPVPFLFNRSKETKPLLVPKGVLTPYNAQATLHLQPSFWALLLPITVHGRVSDIWRSYFAQRLFWDVGLQVGFLPRPIVVQDRNPHSNLGDLDAERDLYQKSEHLVEFLGKWEGKGRTLIERVEELWVALYERQYIERADVLLLQQWLQALIDVGYKFPEIVKSPSSSQAPYPSVAAKKGDEEDVNTDVCKDTTLTFWTSDLHDGTRLDIPSALVSMGHKLILAGHKQASSPYPYVFQRKGFTVYKHLSNVISKQYTRHSTRLTEKMVRDNFEFYKNDTQIASTDAFICMFPASMCEMWMPFNKTIIYLPAHRYNLGRCTKKEWDRLNVHLNALVSMNNPKHILGAESFYDKEYLQHYTGLVPLPLYSFSGFYTSNNTYAPTRKEILAFGTWDDRLSTSKFQIQQVHSIYKRYQLSDLVQHRAVVFLPYSVMSYTLTELYSLCIPLFVPSMSFIHNVRRTVKNDRSSLSKFYCNYPELDKTMKAHPSSTHPYSPNVDMTEDPEAESYWLQFADFFYWPHVTYFDDFKDLERKLDNANFNKIHDLMVDEVERRKKELLDNLCRASKKVQSRRVVPQDYSVAIQQLYGVSKLQVM